MQYKKRQFSQTKCNSQIANQIINKANMHPELLTLANFGKPEMQNNKEEPLLSKDTF